MMHAFMPQSCSPTASCIDCGEQRDNRFHSHNTHGGTVPSQETQPVTTPETVDVVLDDALPEGLLLQRIRHATTEAGLPAIEVSVQQGRMLETLVLSARARNILEVGTLGGYSTACLVGGAGPLGRVTSIEYEPEHAAVAYHNLDEAGLIDRVSIKIGDAHQVMRDLTPDSRYEPFDFVFIDADKESNADYLKLAIPLCYSGATIVVDNVIRDGRVIDPTRTDKLEFIKTVGTLVSTGIIMASVVQTVGSKGWDGFVIAVKN